MHLVGNPALVQLRERVETWRNLWITGGSESHKKPVAVRYLLKRYLLNRKAGPFRARSVAGRAPATAALAVAADRGRGQAAPLSADGLAAILATAARPRTDGRGVESPTTAHRRGRLDAVIASLLFMGGLRRSEVAAVRWADVTDARDGDGARRVHHRSHAGRQLENRPHGRALLGRRDRRTRGRRPVFVKAGTGGRHDSTTASLEPHFGMNSRWRVTGSRTFEPQHHHSTPAH